jgi:hypothetical protein
MDMCGYCTPAKQLSESDALRSLGISEEKTMAAAESKSRRTEGQDAFALLTADHRAVKTLFKQFETLDKADETEVQKSTLVEKVCNELRIHAQLEEEIFYPAVRAEIDDDEVMDEADVEHTSAKDLIAQLEQMAPGDDHYDAKVTVLGEYIDHHVKEEEGEMFPKARKADIDGIALGEQLLARKSELKAELGIEEDDDSPQTKASNGAKGKSGSAARKSPMRSAR